MTQRHCYVGFHISNDENVGQAASLSYIVWIV